MAVSISFEPTFHRKAAGHAGPVWHITGDPTDPNAQAEQRRLISEGGVVVQPAGRPGTGFVQAAEQARDIRFAAIFTVCISAVWAVIWAVVTVAHHRPAYAALLALGVFPAVLAGIIHAGTPARPRADSNLENSNRK